MRWLPIFVALAGCQSMPSGGGGPPDEVCVGQMVSLGCSGGVANGTITYQGGTSLTNACAAAHDFDDNVTCQGGCYLNVQTANPYGIDGKAILDPAALCAATPEAQVGDACDDNHLCLPTRAQLAADGTVTGQSYLACVNGTCAASTQPTVLGYLAKCAPAILATETAQSAPHADVDTIDIPYGGYCLVAWDAATQRAATGITVGCMGDWDCPDHALCDDHITLTGGGADRPGVCKPGPKGTLTPAMLSE
jgi:hypothetical protein